MLLTMFASIIQNNLHFGEPKAGDSVPFTHAQTLQASRGQTSQKQPSMEAYWFSLVTFSKAASSFLNVTGISLCKMDVLTVNDSQDSDLSKKASEWIKQDHRQAGGCKASYFYLLRSGTSLLLRDTASPCRKVPSGKGRWIWPF